jgi:hypothetical protein
MNETGVLPREQGCASRSSVGMTALLKPTKRMRAMSSQLKTLCEVNYAASILRHMWVSVCHHMDKFATALISP